MRNQSSFEILLFLIGALLIALVVVGAIGGVFRANKSDALQKALNYKKYACSPPEISKYSNLLLVLHFDDNYTINDTSRFGTSELNLFNTTLGIKNQGLLLNSTNYSASFVNSIYNSSAFSMSFWFNVTSVTANGFLLKTEFLSVNVSTANNVFVQFPGLVTSNYSFAPNAWNNIAIQRNAVGLTQVFYNGDLVEKITNTTLVTQTNFTFGAVGNNIVATVDEFKYFNTFLTQDDVLNDLFCGIRN
ncbi:Concanavalin A-like lectin/glucanases superfamily protein [uncultured archaeon]|nr:Concanavalin A-like lectin/glucanases superfamily protein [uncultured archaeon]